MITQGYASNGKSISFVLLEPTTIAGKKTKKGQIITGIAKEDRNRLSVSFSEIKIDNQSYDIEQGCDHHHRNRLITDNQQ